MTRDQQGAPLDGALESYAAFLAHQLAEVAVLMSGAGDTPGAQAARARLERMLADLRDLSPAAPVEQRVDLAELFATAAAALSEPGRRVRLSVDGAVAAVSADVAQLSALAAHLTRMALAQSAGGVRLVLRGAAGPGGRIHVELEHVEGAGDDRDPQRRLVPFERPAGTGALLGAGVSGPAAARIVSAHQGTLGLCTRAGNVVAMFDLPAADL